MNDKTIVLEYCAAGALIRPLEVEEVEVLAAKVGNDSSGGV